MVLLFFPHALLINDLLLCVCVLVSVSVLVPPPLRNLPVTAFDTLGSNFEIRRAILADIVVVGINNTKEQKKI